METDPIRFLDSTASGCWCCSKGIEFFNKFAFIKKFISSSRSKGTNEFSFSLNQGLRPKIPKKTHPSVKGLLERCWHQDPEKRPIFEEIIDMLQQIMNEVNVVV